MTLRLLTAAVLLAVVPTDPPWRVADPDYHWQFPRDHWSHEGFKTEWWYVTGRLHSISDPSRSFGYQFTFFRVGVRADTARTVRSAWVTPNVIMGHLAITDLADGTHVFSDLLYRATPFLGGYGSAGDSVIAWSVGPPGTDARWTLKWNGNGFDVRASDARRGIALDLHTQATTPILLQGRNGYSRKGSGASAASMYYSMPRLETTGSLSINGEDVAVRGSSWMDKEFGSNQLDSTQTGWDWFSLRLSDGRDVMLYQLRHRNGSRDTAFGSIRYADGTVEHLAGAAWTVTADETWTSPDTDATYPTRWTLTLGGRESLELRAIVPQSENIATRVRNLFYWEGAIDVTFDGVLVGEGYVELTGYGSASRPAI